MEYRWWLFSRTNRLLFLTLWAILGTHPKVVGAVPIPQLRLIWIDRSTNESGFKVERRTGMSGTFTQIATLGADITTFLNTNLAPKTTYCYRVRAYNAAGNSAFSAEACGRTADQTFTLTVTKNGTGQGTVRSAATGINCGSDCAESYANVTSVTLGATPASGSRFTGWTGGGCEGVGKCLLLLNAATTVTATFTRSTSRPPGLVAAYGFNGGSGTNVPDISGNNNVGRISGAAWTKQGKYGAALSFDGLNDSVSIGDTRSLDLTTGMTLEAWVYPASFSRQRSIIVKERSGRPSVYALTARNDTFASRATGKIIRTDGSRTRLMSTALLPANTWSHLALTYNGNTLRLYLNGRETSSQLIPGSILTSSGPLRLGGNSAYSGSFFRGRIDEVRVYNRALTASEVAADMNSPIVP